VCVSGSGSRPTPISPMERGRTPIFAWTNDGGRDVRAHLCRPPPLPLPPLPATPPPPTSAALAAQRPAPTKAKASASFFVSLLSLRALARSLPRAGAPGKAKERRKLARRRRPQVPRRYSRGRLAPPTPLVVRTRTQMAGSQPHFSNIAVSPLMAAEPEWPRLVDEL